MNARQAYLELLNGNRITSKHFQIVKYVEMTELGYIQDDTKQYFGSLDTELYYEIYTEPKRKVRYAPVIFKGPYLDELCRSTALFTSEAKAIEWCQHPLVNGKFIQVDWDNAAEVEE